MKEGDRIERIVTFKQTGILTNKTDLFGEEYWRVELYPTIDLRFDHPALLTEEEIKKEWTNEPQTKEIKGNIR